MDAVVCENSSPGLRGVTIIELEHATEALTGLDRAYSRRRGRRREALVVQPLVRPFFVIMRQESANGCPEMRLAEWHDAVQALGLDRQNKPLGKRVQSRSIFRTFSFGRVFAQYGEVARHQLPAVICRERRSSRQVPRRESDQLFVKVDQEAVPAARRDRGRARMAQRRGALAAVFPSLSCQDRRPSSPSRAGSPIHRVQKCRPREC